MRARPNSTARRTPRLAGAWLGIGVFSLSVCGSVDCASIGYSALAVRVQDAGGAQVCDAVVTVTDGDFSETLTPSEATGDWVFFGPFDRAGTYRIEATRDGLVGAVAGIEVGRAGDCDRLQTVHVAVELDT